MNKAWFLVFFILSILSGCGSNNDFEPSLAPLVIPDSLDKFTDPRDGQEYYILSIGSQIWMAQNLKYRSKYNDSINYNSDPDFGKIYGCLYKVEEVIKDNLCPEGWELPSDFAWKELEMRLGLPKETEDANFRGVDDWGPRPYTSEASGYEGERLKTNTIHWKTPNNITSKNTVFYGLPGGYLSPLDKDYHDIGVSAIFLSSDYDSLVTVRRIAYYTRNIDRVRLDTAYRFSVRCIKKAGN
jgi:uncharacterized protein (TIGR02145 family)